MIGTRRGGHGAIRKVLYGLGMFGLVGGIGLEVYGFAFGS